MCFLTSYSCQQTIQRKQKNLQEGMCHSKTGNKTVFINNFPFPFWPRVLAHKGITTVHHHLKGLPHWPLNLKFSEMFPYPRQDVDKILFIKNRLLWHEIINNFGT